MTAPISWEKHKLLLVEGTKTAVQAFLKAKKPNLCAIGFVFELWNASPQFDLCADTKENQELSLANPHGYTAEEIRWNSGNYRYPAVLLSGHELGQAWNDVARILHELADDKRFSQDVYDGLVRISCETLAELAPTGIFGAWQNLDFNVSEVGDPIETVSARHAMIRSMIQGSSQG